VGSNPTAPTNLYAAALGAAALAAAVISMEVHPGRSSRASRGKGGTIHLVATRNRQPRRQPGYESPGVIDFPWDTDSQAGSGPRSDVTCAIPWRADGFEAIEVYLDPALGDRAGEICRTIEGLAGAHRDIDTLSRALLEFGSDEELAVAIHEEPPEAMSVGVVAVAITIG
jgi:hypothetical protein